MSVLSRQEGGGRASCLWDPVLLPSRWLGLSQQGQANVPSARHRDRSKKKKKKQEKQMKGKAEKKGAASRSSSSTKSSAKGLSESFKSKEFVSSDESSSAESKKEVGPCSGAGESLAPVGCSALCSAPLTPPSCSRRTRRRREAPIPPPARRIRPRARISAVLLAPGWFPAQRED